jgi:general stress protein YciG
MASKSRSAKSRAGSKKKTGFAAMSKEKRREVARKGGRAAAKARSKKR